MGTSLSGRARASRPGRWFREWRRGVLETPERLRSLEGIVRAGIRSPLDEFVVMTYATRTDGLFDGTYDEWRVRRIAKILALHDLEWFVGRRILELGAGHGDIGAVLASLGAEVVCAEGRRENLNFGRLKHRDVPQLSFVEVDLDQDFGHLGSFDLILHLGLLYHIADVDAHLATCFAMADEVVLESVVCDSVDPHRLMVVEERSAVNEEALSGLGSRPSPFYIERLAVEHGFAVDRHFTSDLNAWTYVYDWEHRDDGDPGGFNLRRFWHLRRSADVAEAPVETGV